MAIPTVAVGGPVTASETNLLVSSANSIALTGTIPNLTAPATGSAIVSPNGQITFTNVDGVHINGCFTGGYANYRVVFNITGRSAAQPVQLRLRQAGTDLASATYGYVRQIVTGSTTQAPLTATASTLVQLDTGAAAGASLDGYIDIFGPTSAVYTAMTGNFTAWSSAAPSLYLIGIQNSTAAASDGMTIYPNGGTFSGTVRVYAYNNLV